MRRLLVVLGLLASISGVRAQEFEIPTLRGTDSFVPDAPGPLYRPRWSGFYAGGQIGFGVANYDFTNATQDLIEHALRNTALENEQRPSDWTALGKTNTGSTMLGAFLGYNTGWESLILGFELNYNHSNFSSDAPQFPISRATSAGGNSYALTISGSASMQITDVLSLRARAGYEIGNFLPYAFIGAVAGRANVAHAGTAAGVENPQTPCLSSSSPPCTPFSFTESEVRNGAFIWGWSLGGGLETMIMPKVFLRTEYEYVAFATVFGIRSQIQSGRLGLGYKF